VTIHRQEHEAGAAALAPRVKTAEAAIEDKGGKPEGPADEAPESAFRDAKIEAGAKTRPR
jgi:hypothetical protein